MITRKTEIFIAEYLRTWNASEAARAAGFKQPQSQGPRLLKKVEVAERISIAMQERAMGADEVLTRLAEQARSSIAEFIIVRDVPILDKEGEIVGYQQETAINWDAVQQRGHLVKSLSPQAKGIKIELHDGQVALIQIGKALGILKENVEQRGETTTHMPELDRLLDKIYGQPREPDNPGT